MKKTYKYQLPQNKEVKGTNVRVENGEILVDVEFEEKFEPKDGDFLVSDGCTFIYSDMKAKDKLTYSSYCGDYQICGGISIEFSNNWTPKKGCRFATPEEKADFLERLEKECKKRWNAETKQLEDIRWRAEDGKSYYYVGFDFIVRERIDERNITANENYKNNNYFRTSEAAKKVANQIKELFKNSKAE